MCFAPFNRLCHWGPLGALGKYLRLKFKLFTKHYFICTGIIKIVTAMTLHCASMWWPPHLTLGGFLNSACFLTLSGLTLFNFLSACFHGPGYLPMHWKPVGYRSKYLLQSIFICL